MKLFNTELRTDFPDDFLWSASTSAFQVEGAAFEAGKGLTVADLRSRESNFMDTSVSIDHYHHLEEDVALLKELGLTAYRFSISWARIFPNGDDVEPNQEGLDFYHRLIDLLVENDIEPLVTIFHFDLPQALVNKYKGWASRQCVFDFVRYATVLFDEFGDKVSHWITINEQSLLANVPSIIGLYNDDLKQLRQTAENANYHMFLAQAIIIERCHQKLPNAKIGPAVSYMTNLPFNHKSQDALVAKNLEETVAFINMEVAVRGEFPTYYLRNLADEGISLPTQDGDYQIFQNGRADFLGLNWYCTSIFRRKAGASSKMLKGVMSGIERYEDPDLHHTDWGFSFDPVGLRYALQRVHDRYPHTPIIITECGWSDHEVLTKDGQIHDEIRVAYLNDHIHQLREAIRDGVNVIGFSPWSFIDLLSVKDGMEKRYGLVFVDRDNTSAKNLRRYKKDSFYFYQEVIRTKAKNITTLTEYVKSK